jgi:anhydro-N-acetylmuramic acid kinase
MSLDEILRKKQLTVLGLNSGTSADGLDLAVVRIRTKKKGRIVDFLFGTKKRYGVSLRRKILNLADAGTVALDELVHLDNLLGQFYGRTASSFMTGQGAGLDIDVVASHGQTVRHLPRRAMRTGGKVNGSLQIGSADFIAAATGRVVVSDFRQADIALGNEGAPITVSAMGELFASRREPRLVVNIGGISNFFYFPVVGSGRPILAGDCGPGNSLSDILSLKLSRAKYDRNGRCARRGKACPQLVSWIMSGAFYRGRTVSTGREAFGVALADELTRRARRRRLVADDIMATAAEVTVRSIARRIRPLARGDKQLSKLYLTGGGRHNIFFVDGLMDHLPGINIESVDVLGIGGDYVEAAAYAVMAEACLRSRAVATGFSGGSRPSRWPVLGKITQPPGAAERADDGT